MKQDLRFHAAILALLLFFAGSVGAQDLQPTPDYTPPCLRSELDQIAFLEGNWDVVSRQRVNFAEDRWDESRAHATWTPILAGCAFQEHWSGIVDGQPLQWIQILAYDHREETWQQVMIDWAHGNLIMAEGHYDEGKLTFTVPHMRRGKLLIDRTTIEAASADRVEWTMETSQDGGQTWITFWTLRYSRQ